MAYSHTQYEIQLTGAAGAALSIASTGDKATWLPGYVPHRIRGCAFVITTAATVTPPILNFTTQLTALSNAGIAAGDIAIVKPLLAQAAGVVVYKDGIQAKVKPGQSVVLNVGTAASAGAGVGVLFAEPEWETPANNTSMAATT